MKSRWYGGLIFLWACLWGGLLHALPFPTEFLAEPEFWDTEDFKEKFEGPATHTPIVWKSWPGEPVIWEVPPHHVSARFVDGRIDTITVLFLDSGTTLVICPEIRLRLCAWPIRTNSEPCSSRNFKKSDPDWKNFPVSQEKALP